MFFHHPLIQVKITAINELSSEAPLRRWQVFGASQSRVWRIPLRFVVAIVSRSRGGSVKRRLTLPAVASRSGFGVRTRVVARTDAPVRRRIRAFATHGIGHPSPRNLVASVERHIVEGSQLGSVYFGSRRRRRDGIAGRRDGRLRLSQRRRGIGDGVDGARSQLKSDVRTLATPSAPDLEYLSLALERPFHVSPSLDQHPALDFGRLTPMTSVFFVVGFRRRPIVVSVKLVVDSSRRRRGGNEEIILEKKRVNDVVAGCPLRDARQKFDSSLDADGNLLVLRRSRRRRSPVARRGGRRLSATTDAADAARNVEAVCQGRRRQIADGGGGG